MQIRVRHKHRLSHVYVECQTLVVFSSLLFFFNKRSLVKHAFFSGRAAAAPVGIFLVGIFFLKTIMQKQENEVEIASIRNILE